jgi:hypothetical protein
MGRAGPRPRLSSTRVLSLFRVELPAGAMVYAALEGFTW